MEIAYIIIRTHFFFLRFDLESRLQSKFYFRASLIGHGISIACLRAGRPVLRRTRSYTLSRFERCGKPIFSLFFLFFHDYAYGPVSPVQSKVNQDRASVFWEFRRKICRSSTINFIIRVNNWKTSSVSESSSCVFYKLSDHHELS